MKKEGKRGLVADGNRAVASPEQCTRPRGTRLKCYLRMQPWGASTGTPWGR